jgi:hypothetical protein
LQDLTPSPSAPYDERRANDHTRVEILYFQGLLEPRSGRRARGTHPAEIGVEPVIQMVEVPDEDAAIRLGFLGSPAVHVNGRDIEPGADDRADLAFSCRVYRTEQGFSGQADTWIRDAFVEAR